MIFFFFVLVGEGTNRNVFWKNNNELNLLEISVSTNCEIYIVYLRNSVQPILFNYLKKLLLAIFQLQLSP